MQHPPRFLLTRGGLTVGSAQCHSHVRGVKELVVPWPWGDQGCPWAGACSVCGVNACPPVPSSASPSLQPQGHFSEYMGQTGSCLLPPGLDPGIRSLMGNAI